MHTPSASELLVAWERGLAQPPLKQALTLLAAAYPDLSPDVLAHKSIGQRDADLLTLHERTFGPSLSTLATCPGCGDRLDIAFNVDDIRAPLLPSGMAEPAVDHDETLSLRVADYDIRFRLPNSLDLLTAEHQGDANARRTWLLHRCVVTITHHGELQAAAALPADVEQAVVARMAQADPQADVHLSCSCPACGSHWQAVFDIASFLWTEIDVWARRILHEVHQLASAYGWPEADILAMSPARRQYYLSLITG